LKEFAKIILIATHHVIRSNAHFIHVNHHIVFRNRSLDRAKAGTMHLAFRSLKSSLRGQKSSMTKLMVIEGISMVSSWKK
jgi:hypothetical protein